MASALRQLTTEDCVRLVQAGMGADNRRRESDAALLAQDEAALKHAEAVGELCAQARVGGMRAVRQILNTVLAATDTGYERAAADASLPRSTLHAVLSGMLFGASIDEGCELFADAATVESIFGLALATTFDAEVRREAVLILYKLASHPSARTFLQSPEAIHGLCTLISAGLPSRARRGSVAHLELSAALRLMAAALEPVPPPTCTPSEADTPLPLLALQLLPPVLTRVDKACPPIKDDPKTKDVRAALEAARQRLNIG